MRDQPTPTGLKTQIHLLRLSKLADCCQLLIGHLTRYAVSASNFDEDAFADILRVNMAIQDANASLVALQGPQNQL